MSIKEIKEGGYTREQVRAGKTAEMKRRMLTEPILDFGIDLGIMKAEKVEAERKAKLEAEKAKEIAAQKAKEEEEKRKAAMHDFSDRYCASSEGLLCVKCGMAQVEHWEFQTCRPNLTWRMKYEQSLTEAQPPQSHDVSNFELARWRLTERRYIPIHLHSFVRDHRLVTVGK